MQPKNRPFTQNRSSTYHLPTQVIPSQLDQTNNGLTFQQHQPSSSNTTSATPPAQGSVFKSAHDERMISWQLNYQNLRGAAKKEQDEWVQNFLIQMGICNRGLRWHRKGNGYTCAGGAHRVPDELIADGTAARGGYLTLNPDFSGIVARPGEKRRKNEPRYIGPFFCKMLGDLNTAVRAYTVKERRTPYEKMLAERQIQYDSLTDEQRIEQDKWVRRYLETMMKPVCVARLQWMREGQGYRCLCGAHYMTDKMVSDGISGYLWRSGDPRGPGYIPAPGSFPAAKDELWCGPHYSY